MSNRNIVIAVVGWILALAVPPADGAAPAPRVALETGAGTVVIELYADRAPETVANFLEYVREGFYDGTVFHRVIQGFMIQGGGMTEALERKPTRAPIRNEAGNGLTNDRGTVAMARTSDPHSATAQFFINTRDNGFLNHTGPTADGWGYCVFGKVVEGMEVVDRIEAVPTTTRGMHRDVPSSPVVIERASVLP